MQKQIEGWEPTPDQFIAEHPTWQFDVEKLQNELNKFKDYIEVPEYKHRSGGLNGWSLLGRVDDLQSGFEFKVGIQHPPYKTQDMTDPDPKVYYKMDYAREHKIYHMMDYDKPTSICVGYFKEVIDFLEDHGIKVRRARLSHMCGGGEIQPHTDGNFFRIHIPILTSDSRFVHNDEAYNLEMGKVYIANVHRYHYVKNQAPTDRWHLVADCWDTGYNFEIGGWSQERWEQECENARLWRDYVDGKRETPEMILMGAKNS